MLADIMTKALTPLKFSNIIEKIGSYWNSIPGGVLEPKMVNLLRSGGYVVRPKQNDHTKEQRGSHNKKGHKKTLGTDSFKTLQRKADRKQTRAHNAGTPQG
jgi:hypothetical protein